MLSELGNSASKERESPRVSQNRRMREMTQITGSRGANLRRNYQTAGLARSAIDTCRDAAQD